MANAAGPIARMTANELNISIDRNFNLIMFLATLIVAPIFGHKIVRNTGKEIVLIGKFEAALIAFGLALLVTWLADRFGLLQGG